MNDEYDQGLFAGLNDGNVRTTNPYTHPDDTRRLHWKNGYNNGVYRRSLNHREVDVTDMEE